MVVRLPSVPVSLAAIALVVGCGEAKAPIGTPLTAPPTAAVTAAQAAPLTTSPPTGVAASVLPTVSPAVAPGADGPSAFATVGHLQGAEHLKHLFQQLATLEAGSAHDDVRILQYGDSHTASDMGVSVFRKIMQSRFGDGGRGFVSIGRPWKSYVQDGVRGSMTSEFEPQRNRLKETHPGPDANFGLLGVAIGANVGGARAWTDLSARSSHVELDYWQEPRGGSFDVFIDGQHAGRIATRAAQSGSGFFAFDVADVPHNVEIRTVGDGAVRVFGMALDRAQAGVVVDALGINGAQIFTALHWNEDHFIEQVRHRAPDLVALAYGTNEAVEPHLEDADYTRGLVDLLGRVSRAAPGAACMLVGPPDLARWLQGTVGYTTSPRLLELIAIQQRVADAAGCAFFSQLDAMGGPGSMAAWAREAQPRAQRDRMHLTRSGYAQVATSLATDVMHAYDAWRAEQGLSPSGSAHTWDVAHR